MRMLVIGHRGAAGLAPENSMAALRAGLEAGADMLEFDVRLTRDNVLILIHDFHMVRTYHNLKLISRSSLAELQSAAGTQAIVTLEQVLDEFFGQIILNIELKGKGTGKAVISLLKKYVKTRSDWDNVLLSSFKGGELRAARKLSKRINLALLHDQNPFLFIAYVRALRLTGVGFHRLYLHPLALEIAKRSGLFIYAYTVNRPHAARLLAEQGIDGIITDHPDRILAEVTKFTD